MDIQAVMDSLSCKRPIFHNEADFQHSLAWEIREMFDGTIRLEQKVDIDRNKRTYLDIFTEHEGRKTAIELKYKMRELTAVIDGERFSISNQGAQDTGRYDVLKDIQRIEQMVKSGLVDEGFLVFLTNDPLYYRESSNEKVTVDHEFRIHHGKVVNGILKWSEDTGQGTMDKREAPIVIEGTYTMSWQEYSQLNVRSNGKLMSLIIHVSADQINKRHPVETDESLVVGHTKSNTRQMSNSHSEENVLSIINSITEIPTSQNDLRDKIVYQLQCAGYEVMINYELEQTLIDIWAQKGEESIALEVRFKTAKLQTITNGKMINLKNQSAQDISRYDYLKDLEKLESVVSKQKNIRGYAILMTNDRTYWNKATKKSVVDEDFRLHQGRKIHGRLSWKRASESTMENRETAIHIQGEYIMDWKPFRNLDVDKNGIFQTLITEVTFRDKTIL